jgi:hypothetical protein
MGFEALKSPLIEKSDDPRLSLTSTDLSVTGELQAFRL